jgi:hypothetical protein
MTTPPNTYSYYDYADNRGQGWVAFAGVLLLIVGGMNICQGIAAVGNSSFFAHGAHYAVGSLNTWGWVVMVLGIGQILVGFGVFMKNQLARWIGVCVFALNSIAQLLFIPAYPFWSLSLFALDVLGMYGLIVYGARLESRS